MDAGARYYVFDLDGTLISLPVEWDKVREELRGLTGTSLEFAPFFLDVQSVVAKDPLLLGPIMRTIDKYEALAVPQARLEDGAMEALSSLSGRAKLSLVTMQGRAACDRVLEGLGIGRFFASSFTREDSMDRTAQVRMALASLEAKEARGGLRRGQDKRPEGRARRGGALRDDQEEARQPPRRCALQERRRVCGLALGQGLRSFRIFSWSVELHEATTLNFSSRDTLVFTGFPSGSDMTAPASLAMR